jgi:hypothetical protein
MPTKVRHDDNFYDDGMDEALSSYPTEYRTEDYEGDEEAVEEEPTQAAVRVSYVSADDDERRKEQAAETRRAMKEADEKRAAELAEVRVAAAWLAERGLATDGLDGDATRRLFRDMKTRHEALEAEMDAIAAAVAAAKINRQERRIHIAGDRCFFVVSVSWSYPSLTGENISVDSNNRDMRVAVGQLVVESAQRGTQGFVTKLLELLGRLVAADEADVATVWANIAEETLELKSTHRKLEVVLTPAQRVNLDNRQLNVEKASRRARAAQARRQREGAASSGTTTFVFNPSAYDVQSVSFGTHIDADDAAAVVAREALASKMAVAHNNGHQTLNANDMPIVVMPPSFSSLTSLTVLNLHNCHLRNIPNLGFMRLEKLYLSNNQIDTIAPCVFDSHRKGLRILDLSHNRIDTIPDGMTALSNLEILQLEYNRVKRMCDVSKWKKLEVLELTDNCLRELPPAVAGLERLWRLKIGANHFENLPIEVYYQGLAKVREYLTELTTTNLPVARRRLAADVLAQCDTTSAEAWCDVVLATDAARRAVPSYLLEARLPGLTKLAVPLPPGTDVGAPTHQVHLPKVSAHALDALVRLLNASLDTDTIATDPTMQVQLSELISTHGSHGLMAQLTSVLRGHEIDADDLLADDLVGLAMHSSSRALGDDDGAATSDGAIFRVGDLVTIVVGPLGKRFVAHRGLLAARCPFFSSMFRSGLADARAAEVPLEEVDPEVFAAFLSFVYADSASKLVPDNVVALLFLAVEFNVDRLRDLAESMVGFNVDVDNVAQVIQLAHFLDSERLKKACMYFVHNNYAAVRSTDGYHELQDEVKKELADKLAKWNSGAGLTL